MMGFLFSLSQYFESLQDVHDDDLVLATDSLDTWFQLPAGVFLSRYFAINARANELVTACLGSEAAASAKQSIVFSAETKCWPREAHEMGCWAVPESPLPKNLYGSRTDVKVENTDVDHGYEYIRPRYLNAGFTIGPE